MVDAREDAHSNTAPSAISRRRLIKGAAAGGMILAAPYVARAATGKLVISTPGGAILDAYRKAYIETFTAKTGIEVEAVPYIGAGKVKAMVENKSLDVDLLDLDSPEAAQLSAQGLLEKIDYSTVDASLMVPEAKYDDFVCVLFGGTVMGWNTDNVKAGLAPKTWADYFDPTNPVRRSLYKAPSGTIEAAAMASGQDFKKLYPLDVDKALAVMEKIRNKITWWDSGAKCAQLLADGEVDLGTAWSPRLFGPMKSGAPIDFTYNYIVCGSDAFAVPKGAKNFKTSMMFIDNMLQAKNQATFASLFPVGPVNPKAFDFIAPEIAAKLPLAGESRKTAVIQSATYWAENGEKVQAEFNKWLLG